MANKNGPDAYGELCSVSDDLEGFLGNDPRLLTYVKAEDTPEQITLLKKLSGMSLTWGIIDSGLNPNHPQIKGVIVEMRSFTDQGPEDTLGHGTAVACSFVRGENFARIYSAKVTNKENKVSLDAVLKALDWLVECNVGHINMSLAFDQRQPNVLRLCDKIEKIAQLPRPPIIEVAAGNHPILAPYPPTVRHRVFSLEVQRNLWLPGLAPLHLLFRRQFF